MDEKRTKKTIEWFAVLCVLAVIGLGVWAVIKTMSVFQTDEPLIYKNEKNLRELNKIPLFDDVPENPDGK